MEKSFEIQTQDGIIRGINHIPDGNAVCESPIVIAHGYFSANHVGPSRLYVQIARTLTNKGFTIVRADMLGVGDSDGEFSCITYQSEIRDLNKICDYAKETFKASSLILLGHSMGGNLVLRVSKDRDDILKLVLLAPDAKKKGGVDKLFSTKQLQELDALGHTIRKGMHISKSFIDEIRNDMHYEIAKQLEIPVAVIQGDEDNLYCPDGARKLAECAPKGFFYLIPEADHNFLSIESRNAMIQKIKEFLCVT
ncbi:MAG: alpha/beta hydrolase [Candidatus Scalindua sp.]